MKGPPIGDFLVLFAFAAVPVAVFLFLLRGRIGGEWRRFWPPFGLGLLMLSILIAVALAWATGQAQAELATCARARLADATAGPVDACAMGQLLVLVVGATGVVSLLMYLAGGLGWQFVQRQRGSMGPTE